MIFDYYLLISLITSLFYVVVMILCAYGWHILPHFNLSSDKVKVNRTKISVLIAARNESKNISNCIQSIIDQTYPKELFEIIVIDDHSEDDTFETASSINASNLKVLQLANYNVKGSKKKAIEIGVKEANGQLIVTTDADCITQPNWLAFIASFYETGNYKFIAAPVNFYKEKNTFERFQSLDFIGLMAVTGAGIALKKFSMCNGANLAYERAVFYEVNGFQGIDQLASGDDMLLMQKIALKYPNDIGYLKNIDATVFTSAKEDLKSFINQRVRWASKTNSYKEFLITFILIMVFVFCCAIPLSLFLGFIFGKNFFMLFGILCLIKAVCDIALLYPISLFFRRKDLINVFFPSFWAHLFYIILVGVLANLLYNYEWKGRKVK